MKSAYGSPYALETTPLRFVGSDVGAEVTPSGRSPVRECTAMGMRTKRTARSPRGAATVAPTPTWFTIS